MASKDIWLSIRSNEMMKDTMKALIQEIKAHKIEYVSYGTQKRIYLHLKNAPESFRGNILNNWVYYQPVSVVKRPSNISDYDVVDW